MEHWGLSVRDKDNTKGDKTYAMAAEANVSKNESCFPL